MEDNEKSDSYRRLCNRLVLAHTERKDARAAAWCTVRHRIYDCKANLPGEDYQRIAAEFGFIWFWNPGRREQWQYTAEESGETGAALLRIWRGNMVLVIVSLAVMAVLVWMG